MSNPQIAAREIGDDFQALVFWKYALEMLLPNSNIIEIRYEEKEFSPYDDIMIKYNKAIKSETNDYAYEEEFIQCKYKNQAYRYMTYKDLIDPDYFKNKKSILKRGFDLFKKRNGETKSLYRLITTSGYDTNDCMFKDITNLEKALNVNRLLKSTKPEDIIMLKEIKDSIGCESQETLKEFLSILRFDNCNDLAEIKKEITKAFGRLGIEFDSNQKMDSLISIIKNANRKSMTIFHRDDIKELLIQGNLLTYKRVKIGVIGIGKEDKRINDIRKLDENCLDLSKYFDDRKLKGGVEWNTLKKETQEFINNRIVFGTNYLLDLSCICSIAFMLGKLIGFKKGDIALNNRNGQWERDKARDIRSDYIIDKATINGSITTDEVYISISIGDSDIKDDVIDYLKNENIDKYNYLMIKNKDYSMQNDIVWDFANNVSKEVKKYIKEHYAKITHIFYRGPIDLFFILGQYSNEWGTCQIYDYDFQNEIIAEKKYIKGIKI